MRPSFSKNIRDSREQNQVLMLKLQGQEVPKVKFKQSQFKSKMLKEQVKIGQPVFSKDVRFDQIRAGYTELLDKLNKSSHFLIQVKTGKTVFESDLMRTNFTNPYLKHPETLQNLKTFLQDSMPQQQSDPVVNYIEESNEPLLSIDHHSRKTWMPQGEGLKQLSYVVNNSLQTMHAQSYNDWASAEGNNDLHLQSLNSTWNSSNKWVDTHQTVQHPCKLIKRDPTCKPQSFPISPSFVHNYSKVKQIKLKPSQEFCKERNIPFSCEEDKFYKCNQAKIKFKKFSKAINECYDTGRPDTFETGISLLQDSSKKPPPDMVNSQFTDLRQYMPDLGLKTQQGSNIVDKSEVSVAYQRLESRRFNAIEALKKQLDQPFIALKAKRRFSKTQRNDPIREIVRTNNEVKSLSVKMNAKLL